MFKKIDIPNFGLFVDYNWNDNIGKDMSCDIFKKINIIYGRNYSGKTTLSRIFRWIEEGKINEKYTDSKFTITDGNGISITENNISYSKKIRVYNTDFIKSHLSWLHDNENGEILPFALLGSQNIEATKKIEKIENELGNIEIKDGLYWELSKQNIILDEISKSIKNKEKTLNDRLTSHANQNIKKSKYYLRQDFIYNITNLKNEIEEIKDNLMKYILDEEEIKAYKLTIDEVEKNVISAQKITQPDYMDLYSRTKTISEKKITLTKTLNELLENAALQKWIDDGRQFHEENTKKCAFCTSDLPIGRLDTINAHFSKESEELKNAIEHEKSILLESKNYIAEFYATNNINKDDFYSLFFNDYDTIKNEWESDAGKHTSFIEKLTKILDERYNNIFNPILIENTNVSIIDFEHTISLLNNIIKNHNDKIVTIEDDKQTSRKLLRYAENARFLLEIKYNDEINAINDEKNKFLLQQEKIDKLNKRILCLEEDKRQISLLLNDEGKAADKINSHLSSFFGTDNIFLKPEKNDDNPRIKFIVMRGDKKAFNLSEGECSLISFCYFIAKMEDELNGTENDKLIIYIDDPISSLDNNHIFFMYSLIDSILVKNIKFGQLFISTHNLDFLKYIQRFSIDDDFKKRNMNYFTVDKLKKDNNYRCFINKMPVHLKNYVTEYNYLFHEIYKMAVIPIDLKQKSIEGNFSVFYNLPNIMRRFLECYLFYRFPNTKNPLKNLSKIFDGNIPTLVNRIINEYSHLTWGERGTLVIDIGEAETIAKDIIKALMSDNQHFEALCESVGVEKNVNL